MRIYLFSAVYSVLYSVQYFQELAEEGRHAFIAVISPSTPKRVKHSSPRWNLSIRILAIPYLSIQTQTTAIPKFLSCASQQRHTIICHQHTIPSESRQSLSPYRLFRLLRVTVPLCTLDSPNNASSIIKTPQPSKFPSPPNLSPRTLHLSQKTSDLYSKHPLSSCSL